MKKIVNIITALFILFLLNMPLLALADINLEASNSQYLYINDSNQTGLDITGDATFEGWINFESIRSTNAICGKYDSAGAEERSYRFDYKGITNNKLYFLLSSDGTLQNYSAAVVEWSPSVGTSYHVAVTFNASTREVKFYVDGSQQGATQFVTKDSIYNGAANFELGSWQNGTNPFDGRIDDFRVWNVVRTEAQINDNKDVELTGSETGLVGYWKLANSLLDETSYNNDLTNKNGATLSNETLFTYSSTDPDPAEECSFSSNIDYDTAEGLQGVGTYQNLFLGTNTSVPSVCIHEVGGDFVSEHEFFDATYTPVSVCQRPNSVIISVIAYDGDGNYFEQTLNITTETRETYLF
ncbi:LamG domain-containing protein [bacterium]|nr:LamG domain-containing protein [bacterium]